ncbi:hypothetical protein [Cecembia lonarensis]|uniref:Uncharacterized protein n=1 Tax=Cecembia lonarensis (strain CCUG 58316 / KCTC 22772 / LW9) TaxID=1225176 RepID=K1KY05_CECL9|nr:hypothetical protein [Cecembia lonarensis]EKB49020.1 hypothetical protein B879_02363 [Cecembia lonarensis LW9]
MTDDEFDLLDELYFVHPYEYLKATLGWEDERLKCTLESLYQKSFIKCLAEPDHEIFEVKNLKHEAEQMYFLATKKGLMAHNGRYY